MAQLYYTFLSPVPLVLSLNNNFGCCLFVFSFLFFFFFFLVVILVVVLVALVKAGEPLYTVLRGFLLYVQLSPIAVAYFPANYNMKPELVCFKPSLNSLIAKLIKSNRLSQQFYKLFPDVLYC